MCLCGLSFLFFDLEALFERHWRFVIMINGTETDPMAKAGLAIGTNMAIGVLTFVSASLTFAWSLLYPKQ